MNLEQQRRLTAMALLFAAVAALSLAGCARRAGTGSTMAGAGAGSGAGSGAPGASGAGAGAAPMAGGAAAATTGAAGELAPKGAAGQGAEGQGARRIPAVTVQGYVAEAGTLAADRDTAGVVAPSVTSQVAAQVSGYVARVQRQSGDWVAAGEVVVRLEETALGIALANAQAALESAKINLAAVQDATSQANVRLALQVDSAQATLNSAQRTHDSQKALFAIGGISAAALDTAGSQLAKAQAELESAKTALEQNKRGFATTANQNVESLKIAVATAANNLRQAEFSFANASIKAPFAGQISSINVAPGMFVGQSTSVFALVSRERQVNFSVAPSDAPALAQGTPIDFESGGARHRLRIKYAPSAPVNGIVPMAAMPTARFELPFGTVGNLRYRVALARGVIVPITALETQETRNYVFTVEKGKAAIRYVTIVAESGAEVALAGISGGAVVILNAPPGLLAGAAVQPVMAPRP